MGGIFRKPLGNLKTKMGLDIGVYSGTGKYLEHSFRAGSYSGFNEFRNYLRDLILSYYDLKKIDGMKEKRIFFQELLFHSDCDGRLVFRECERLLKDFEIFNTPEMKTLMILENLDEENQEDLKYYEELLGEWEKALKIAVKNKGYLLFC
jgi:hypothetical protein